MNGIELALYGILWRMSPNIIASVPYRQEISCLVVYLFEENPIPWSYLASKFDSVITLILTLSEYVLHCVLYMFL